jgi:hypothetical protein
MGDYALELSPLPHGDFRGELEPGRPQLPMIWDRGSDYLVHPSGHPLQRTARSGETLRRRGADPGFTELTARHKTPLVLSQFPKQR